LDYIKIEVNVKDISVFCCLNFGDFKIYGQFGYVILINDPDTIENKRSKLIFLDK